MNRSDIRTNIRTILMGGSDNIPDARINRAVTQAIAALSFYFPRERVYQTVYNESVDDEQWTSASSHGTWVSLTNKPIRFGSESVSTAATGGTASARNTDYEMDYIGGRIRTISGGNLSTSTGYYIDYKMDAVSIDISSALTSPIAVDRVDVLSSDLVPVEFEGWDSWGDYLMVTSRGANSQRRFADNDHIRVYYIAAHTDPSDSTAGSVPVALDEILLVGVSGYVLLMESMQQDRAAITELRLSGNRLDANVALHGQVQAILDNVSTYYADTNIALDKVMNGLQANSQSIKSEIAAALSYLSRFDFHAGDADKAIADVAAHVTDAETALDQVENYINGLTTDGRSALDDATTGAIAQFNLANAALDKIEAEIQGASASADDHLDTGDAFINTSNIGPDVAGEWRRYAEVQIQMAHGFISEANVRVQQGQGLVEASAAWVNIANAFVNEATLRLQQAAARMNTAQSHLAIADRDISTAQGYIEAANARWLEMQGFLQEATGRLSIIEHYLAEVNQRMGELQAYANDAQLYQNSAATYRNMSDSLRQEANARLISFFDSLRDRSQVPQRHRTTSSVKQYAQYPT